MNGKIFTHSSFSKPIYGYYRGKTDVELWRIYFPYNKEKGIRFLTNWPAKKIQGFEMLPEKGNILVITKSMKDVT